MIIGIVGLIGSGKGAVAEILQEKGFTKMGHSAEISNELKKQGISVSRDNQRSLANEYRKKYGYGYWAKRLLAKVESGRNYVIEGFRNIPEIDEFRKRDDFVLLGVSTGSKRRFSWVIKRARKGDPLNLEEFEKLEKIDFLQTEKEGQQNALCFSMADYYISNEGTFEDLRKSVEVFLERTGI